ncbi:hypothetical protein DACRYDRAFT_15120 [Dacryopinax primogenitus]|uniref:Uncharacterized protein n=1 Tax=Dacryopinax primogenitus (strain DJM 731) TaxID=1858805 RepID=M5GEH3_DACPD|nr:uncharacterized protein DACRYDRAFT_15120 [Dacryopinax primogenitus]EJU03253.1 hypothetical protein DACRYDRAFT_15120 [Dacryopinax primogenitus]
MSGLLKAAKKKANTVSQAVNWKKVDEEKHAYHYKLHRDVVAAELAQAEDGLLQAGTDLLTNSSPIDNLTLSASASVAGAIAAMSAIAEQATHGGEVNKEAEDEGDPTTVTMAPSTGPAMKVVNVMHKKKQVKLTVAEKKELEHLAAISYKATAGCILCCHLCDTTVDCLNGGGNVCIAMTHVMLWMCSSCFQAFGNSCTTHKAQKIACSLFWLLLLVDSPTMWCGVEDRVMITLSSYYTLHEVTTVQFCQINFNMESHSNNPPTCCGTGDHHPNLNTKYAPTLAEAGAGDHHPIFDTKDSPALAIVVAGYCHLSDPELDHCKVQAYMQTYMHMTGFLEACFNVADVIGLCTGCEDIRSKVNEGFDAAINARCIKAQEQGAQIGHTIVCCLEAPADCVDAALKGMYHLWNPCVSHIISV